MDILNETKTTLTWHHEGNFTAEIVNGQIKKVQFCEVGKSPETAPTQCLTSTDFKFLTNVHAALTDLFAQLKEQNEKLGYEFAHDPIDG